ncbi:MAG: prepilin-type N-terminal cleavage/methylation domain-containing protein [Akkermansiaceae bacterium]|nr:prepilin-type N-terminal cleavage/methylation domain-containing protein [Akkermansiaceae bacterium]
MRTAAPSNRSRGGFTLLELVLAMGLLAVVVGMVFATARTSLSLGRTIVESQNEEMLHQAFFDLLENRFSSLPGNTRLELAVTESSSHYLSDLTLQNVPLSFTWGGEERTAKAVQLSTVKRRSGYLDIVLRYYENEILEGSESQFSTSSLDNEPFAEIVLLEDVAYFEWRVLDGRSLEWSYDWDIQGRLPLQMELVMAIGAKGEEIRRVFWIPPKQNPEIVMRQMAQTGGNNENGGGALNIDVNTPGGGADPDGGGRGPGGRGDGGRGGRGGPPPGGGGRPPGR